ncbi:MAG: T9SS type A sorting domain-containing protein [Saprospiraceae bacterium]|nr:T9SS type A sorting domain-containing protein [Saprospiraceae bacterium]
MRLFPLFALFILICQPAFAQQPMFPHWDVDVVQGGQTMDFPFAGGLNCPQFGEADLNNDGISDLVIFDRTGDVVLTFINNGAAGQTDYVYAPEYACFFPKLIEFVLMRDYNQDGAADIFCSSLQANSQEIQVFRGYYEDNILKFAPYIFNYPNCTYCNTNYIYYPDNQPGEWNNLPVAKTDYPGIGDVDGDGDLDIVCFEASLTTSMFFLRNMSVEQGFGVDSLKFQLIDKCFGKFTETGLEACKACLSPNGEDCCEGFAPPTPEAAERSGNRHPGSTALVYDQEGDGDMDLVLGNISFNCMLGLTNGGTPNQAWMTAIDTAFPSYNTSVDLAVFPASFYIDLDNDGQKDFVACPNNKSIGEDRKNVWFYRDADPGPGADFQLNSKSLFVGGMIDFGSVAHPAFADVNADGLMDIVAGNYGYYTPGTAGNASLYLLLNTGTATNPQFTLSDNDWLGMSEFAPADNDFSPSFGDLDGDGDLDMLVGTYAGGLFCYINQAGAGNPMLLIRDPDPMWLGMDVGISSTPAIIDLDNDNRPDVLIGERNGNVNFFKNQGSPTEPVFASTPTLSNLGQLDARLPNQLIGHSVPVCVNTPDGLRLIMGTQNGHLEMYAGIAASSDAFPLSDEAWGNVDDGFRSHPALADLDGDGVLDLLVGNQRGGLSLYRTTLADCTVSAQSPDAPPASRLYVSPNPARDRVLVQTDWAQPVQWRLYNVLGQTMAQGQEPSGTFSLSAGQIPEGLYVLAVRNGGRLTSAKLIVKR